MGFGVWGLGFGGRASNLAVGVLGLKLRVQGSKFGVWALRVGIEGSGAYS